MEVLVKNSSSPSSLLPAEEHETAQSVAMELVQFNSKLIVAVKQQ